MAIVLLYNEREIIAVIWIYFKSILKVVTI